MGEWESTLNVALTAYPRGYRVGKRHPKAQRTFIFCTEVTFGIVVLLIWYKPVAAILLFVLPMIIGLLVTSWATANSRVLFSKLGIATVLM